jgi:hypothetical protein
MNRRNAATSVNDITAITKTFNDVRGSIAYLYLFNVFRKSFTPAKFH